MLENFAFMFHYLSKAPKAFVKKIAKYLARVSHAAAIITGLNRESKIEFIQENCGNHNYITDIYKRGQPSLVKNTDYPGILSDDLKTKLDQPAEASDDNIPNNLALLKVIYNIMVDTETDKNGYGIEPWMFCFKFNSETD